MPETLLDYDFEFILPDLKVADAAFMDRLYEASCDDATLSIRCGQAYLIFTRSASSQQGAVQSAENDLQAAGITFQNLLPN